MDLHQVQISYETDQDRLLIKFAFIDAENEKKRQEIKVHFTRRITLQFWPTVLEAMTKQISLNKPAAAHASHDIVQMQHEASVSQMLQSGGFDTPYESESDTWPMGKLPLLPKTIHFQMQANHPLKIEFNLPDGTGFEIAMGERALHGFCKLLQDAVAKADWGFELEMPGATQEPIPAHLLN
ncbi:MAG: hypothetical protein KGM99_08795 [Burkholderiales bacterium]|nr:hypothetical protein [Burkholderiales bacterium]